MVVTHPIEARAQSNELEDCMLIIGDSVAYGSAVFEVPMQGFPVIQTPPFARFVDRALHDAGAYHLGVYDLSVEASSLTGTLPYTTTLEYVFALAQRCELVVIFPWLNELRTILDDNSTSRFISTITLFVNTFRQVNVDNTIVMMNYYPTMTSALGERIYEGSITNETVLRANLALADACSSAGLIGNIGGVVCMDIFSLFPDFSHVFTTLDRATFDVSGYRPVLPEQSNLLDIFWRENPNGVIRGDGVHLNDIGKQRLADALINMIMDYDATLLTFTVDDLP